MRFNGRGRASEGAKLLEDFLAREPCTLGKQSHPYSREIVRDWVVVVGVSEKNVVLLSTGYILYQRYVRRTKGKEAARKVFSATKALRKQGKLSFQVRKHFNFFV